jgi:hypothetical protein
MKIIWPESDPFLSVPDREELQEELAKDQESSPSGTPQEATEEKSFWKESKGFGWS